jgi:hypothetical protein
LDLGKAMVYPGVGDYEFAVSVDGEELGGVRLPVLLAPAAAA